MNILLGVIIGIASLMALVTAHEFGHFIMARRNGVKVTEFGICFPPRALAWVKGKDGKWHRLPKKDWQKPQKSLVLSLNWLPLGGFCAMHGESDDDARPHSFGSASLWSKTKILLGGVAMNWLVAALIFTILAWVGMPHFLDNQCQLDADAIISTTAPVEVAEVISGSPAEAAGFMVGDKILSIDGAPIYTGREVIATNEANIGETVTYRIRRGDEEQDLTATLDPADSSYILGVSMTSGQVTVRSTWSAPLVGIGTTVQLTGETFRGLGTMIGNLFSGLFSLVSPDASTRAQGQQALASVGDSVSGPVGIVGSLFPNMIGYGAGNIFFLIALISVSLACMNILPIPALDGGRLLLILIFRLRHKKLDKTTEEKIVSRAIYILLVLIVLITILDVIRLF